MIPTKEENGTQNNTTIKFCSKILEYIIYPFDECSICARSIKNYPAGAFKGKSLLWPGHDFKNIGLDCLFFREKEKEKEKDFLTKIIERELEK